MRRECETCGKTFEYSTQGERFCRVQCRRRIENAYNHAKPNPYTGDGLFEMINTKTPVITFDMSGQTIVRTGVW